MEIDLLENDIKYISRNKSMENNSGLPGPITVKFNNKTKRDNFINSTNKKKLKTNIINGHTDVRPIYMRCMHTNKRRFTFSNN